MMDLIIIALSFITGYLIDFIWARILRGMNLKKKRYKKIVLGGFRIHHNLIGYSLVVIGLFYLQLVLIPLGMGMIIGHAIRKGEPILFIERTR